MKRGVLLGLLVLLTVLFAGAGTWLIVMGLAIALDED